MARLHSPADPDRRRLRGDHGGSKGYVVAVVLWLLAAVVLIAVIVGSNLWRQDAPLNTFSPKGSNAQTIHDLVTPVFLVAGVVFVLVEGLVVYISLRRRKGAEDWESDDDFPEQKHGDTRLEIAWTALPALVMFVIAVFTVSTLLDLNDFEDTDMVVRVEGQQWWWQFKYDNNGDGTFGGEGDIVTANDMVIPAGTNVEMQITSNDVIHSFWIPNLTGTRDAVPGIQTSWKIQADEPGRYRGTCKEFCGLSHARMQMEVIALSQDDYDAWVEGQLQPAAVLGEGDFDSAANFAAYDAGRDLFATQCSTCHTIREEATVVGPESGFAAQVSGQAPNLTHLMSREIFAGGTLSLYLGIHDDLDGETPVDNYVTKEGLTPDVNNLENWIRDPSGEKPMAPEPIAENPHGDTPALVGRGMPTLGLSEDQINQLIAYLTTLK